MYCKIQEENLKFSNGGLRREPSCTHRSKCRSKNTRSVLSPAYFVLYSDKTVAYIFVHIRHIQRRTLSHTWDEWLVEATHRSECKCVHCPYSQSPTCVHGPCNLLHVPILAATTLYMVCLIQRRPTLSDSKTVLCGVSQVKQMLGYVNVPRFLNDHVSAIQWMACKSYVQHTAMQFFSSL